MDGTKKMIICDNRRQQKATRQQLVKRGKIRVDEVKVPVKPALTISHRDTHTYTHTDTNYFLKQQSPSFETNSFPIIKCIGRQLVESSSNRKLQSKMYGVTIYADHTFICNNITQAYLSTGCKLTIL
ncbi:unnamed protein product [Onchocerca flexuosa]|uniref:Transposase n=1 Tax=Onchocerca flexuosa TaxID=387005 RepID=A0A183H2W5_9BILA|nr:unnamed protein product [Onchocerca flexuosa]